QREEVLFREAERLDVKLWVRHLLRAKEPLPSVGQALFCFALILGLHRLMLSPSGRFSLATQLSIGYLAFVAAPPLFMALIVTTPPLLGLSLRFPRPGALLVALALAVLLFVPGAELTYFTVQSLGIKDQLREFQEALPNDAGRAAAPLRLVL